MGTLKIVDANGGVFYNVPKTTLIVVASIALAIFVALYLLKSIGVYKLAKNNGEKHAFLAWIPCAWIYLAVKLSGEVFVFGKKMKNFAVFAVIILGLVFAMEIAGYVLLEIPIALEFLKGKDIVISLDGMIQNYKMTHTAHTIYTVINYVSSFVSIIEIFVTVTLYFNLFKRFWPERFTMAAILSVFGFFPIFAFVIRNKKPVNYQEWARQRYANYFANQNPYGNPYGAPNQNMGNANVDPFEETTTKEPEDPFAEFSDKKEDQE